MQEVIKLYKIQPTLHLLKGLEKGVTGKVNNFQTYKNNFDILTDRKDKIKNNKLSENIKSVKWGTVSGLFLKDQFLEALDDDFNMPRALAKG